MALDDHSQYDCFVCCIMSHGDQDCVYGADSRWVQIKEMISNFQPSRCPTLTGKPKLFFIQATQGRSESQIAEYGASNIEDKLEVDIRVFYHVIRGNYITKSTESRKVV